MRIIEPLEKKYTLLTRSRYSYLWPGYTEEASNYHVLLIALIANVKRREHLETWGE